MVFGFVLIESAVQSCPVRVWPVNFLEIVSFFFFKQKTAYELRISDWSSDVCSSDLRRILSDPSAPADKETKRLVLCSGKIAYDLMEARDAAGDKNTQIVRVEQLYPFPGEPLTVRLKKMPNLEDVVWAQEEPKNNSAWFLAEPFIEQCLRSEEHTSE